MIFTPSFFHASKTLAALFVTLFAQNISCVRAADAEKKPTEKTLRFGGYEWTIKTAPQMGPGPNSWDENNVWLDEAGHLHLKISQRNGQWQCAELFTKERLGFGRYQWQIVGRPDRFDPQIVFGLFPYTVPEIGPDGTNEIDIEFARWGKAEIPNGNFSVWPALKESEGETLKTQTHTFDFKLDGDYTTARFDWSPNYIEFWLLGGHRDDDKNTIAHWKYAPKAPEEYIPQHPLPLHINFWLFQGKAPQNAQNSEIIISKFTFTPLKK